MNWKFWQKKEVIPQVEPRVFILDEEQQKPIRPLFDAYMSAPWYADTESHMALWGAIKEQIPEVLDGSWYIEFPDAITARVIEGEMPEDEE